VTGDDMANVRSEISRKFRTKTRGYLKDKINELESNKTKISQTCTEA
jgi:hypothetical protein